jgi:hypothetical protein
MHIPSSPPSLCCSQMFYTFLHSNPPAPLPPPNTYRSDDLHLVPTYPILLPCTHTLLSYLTHYQMILPFKLTLPLTLPTCPVCYPASYPVHIPFALLSSTVTRTSYPALIPYPLLPFTLTLPLAMHTNTSFHHAHLPYPLALQTALPSYPTH